MKLCTYIGYLRGYGEVVVVVVVMQMSNWVRGEELLELSVTDGQLF